MGESLEGNARPVTEKGEAKRRIRINHLVASPPVPAMPQEDSRYESIPVTTPYMANETKEGVEVSKVVAKWDFEGQNESQLSFKEGDIIEVVLQDVGSAGWWQGRRGGKEGIFPNNYVSVIEELHKKKKTYRINQKRVSSRIKDLREKLALTSVSFAGLVAQDLEKNKSEEAPAAAPSPQKDKVIATVARRKKVQGNARQNAISLFDGSMEDVEAELKKSLHQQQQQQQQQQYASAFSPTRGASTPVAVSSQVSEESAPDNQPQEDWTDLSAAVSDLSLDSLSLDLPAGESFDHLPAEPSPEQVLREPEPEQKPEEGLVPALTSSEQEQEPVKEEDPAPDSATEEEPQPESQVQPPLKEERVQSAGDDSHDIADGPSQPQPQQEEPVPTTGPSQEMPVPQDISQVQVIPPTASLDDSPLARNPTAASPAAPRSPPPAAAADTGYQAPAHVDEEAQQEGDAPAWPGTFLWRCMERCTLL